MRRKLSDEGIFLSAKRNVFYHPKTDVIKNGKRSLVVLRQVASTGEISYFMALISNSLSTFQLYVTCLTAYNGRKMHGNFITGKQC